MAKFGKWASRIIIALLAIGAIAVVTCAVLVWFRPQIFETKQEDEAPAEKPEPQIKAVSAKYLFAGTTFWGRRTNTMARASELGVKYPFSQLDSLERDKYQAWIAGLECPVTDKGGVHNQAEEEQIFKFNCDPDYLPEAKNYFTAFLLGNNHTDNQGPEGFAETQRQLAAVGIQYFGSYDYQDGENNCAPVFLPLTVEFDDGVIEEYKMPFGFCSAHGVYGIPRQAVDGMRRYAQVLPTIAMPHMGAEYQATHDAIRQNLYHAMIDAGVEMVLADHPHWTQDTEAYAGKLIVYSMGNFMFDQTSNKEVSRSAAITTDLKVTNASEVDFAAWDELSTACATLSAQACFEKIQSAKLVAPKYDYRFGYIATTSAENRITRRASDAEQAEMAQRLNWSATMAALGQ